MPSESYRRQFRHALEKPDDPRCPQPIKDLIAGLELMSPSTEAELAAAGRIFHSPDDERAAAFWELLKELITGLGKSARRTAVVAAMKLGVEQDAGLRGRIESARLAGRFGMKRQNGVDVPVVGKDRAAQYWIDAKADLADQLDRRLAQLSAAPSDWEPYRQKARDRERLNIGEQARRQAAEQAAALERAEAGHLAELLPQEGVVPPGAQPMYFTRLIDTIVMRGRKVASRTTERWGTAWADDVAYYTAYSWSPGGGPRHGELRAYLNCRDGDHVSSSPPGMSVDKRMVFPRVLMAGEQIFFASHVSFADDTDEWPIIEHGVGGCGVAAGGWTVRLQFSDGHFPVSIWSYGEVQQTQRLVKPPAESPRRLDSKLSPYGYFEHTFDQPLRYPLQYGIGWEWAE